MIDTKRLLIDDTTRGLERFIFREREIFLEREIYTKRREGEIGLEEEDREGGVYIDGKV